MSEGLQRLIAEINPFFGDQPVPVLAQVIHRPAGFQFLQRLPALRAARQLPIIVLTGFTMVVTRYSLHGLTAVRTVRFHNDSWLNRAP